MYRRSRFRSLHVQRMSAVLPSPNIVILQKPSNAPMFVCGPALLPPPPPRLVHVQLLKGGRRAYRQWCHAFRVSMPSVHKPDFGPQNSTCSAAVPELGFLLILGQSGARHFKLGCQELLVSAGTVTQTVSKAEPFVPGSLQNPPDPGHPNLGNARKKPTYN